MSGIEVVGLVLAVIPLFISAAEHYRDVKDTAHRFVDKDLLLQMYREDLISQQAYLILNLRSLLVDVDLDDADKDALLGHLSSESGDNKPALSDLWEQSQMREELIDRFGVGYKPFVILMQRLSKTLMSQIKKHDLLQDHGSINVSSTCKEPASPPRADKVPGRCSCGLLPETTSISRQTEAKEWYAR